MNQGAGAWTRLSFTPSTGRLSVEGDPYSVLGKTREELTGATDPLAALPGSVAGALVDGNGVARDTELNLVIVPGDTRYSNSVTVILEKGHEYDLVSDMATGVAAFGTDGTILRWNRRMSYLFGPREEDVKGKNVEDVLPPPVLYNWNSILSSVHLGHEVRLEFRPSGEKKLEGVLCRGGPGIIGIFSDSSENYNTTKRLRALNRLNQAYIQSTETGLILLDTGLRVLLCNPGFERISGRKGSLIGLQLHDVLPDDSYRWVHEASERLLGEERAEQSALVPFNVEGERHLLVRHTLRAVRNEMNQAVNFVCLFEDRTELTSLREEVNSLKNCLTGMAGIAEEIMQGDYAGVCRRVLELTGSRAVLRYSYDSSETLSLTEVPGDWPREIKGMEPAELGFPTIVWRGDDHRVLAGGELGILRSSFERCSLVPLGKGTANRGFLLLCDPAEPGYDGAVLKLMTSLVRSGASGSQSGDGSRTAGTQAGGKDMAGVILGSMAFPAALFRRNGEMVHLNPPMEKLTGVRADGFTSGHLQALIDPEGHGLTLDSLITGESPAGDPRRMIWKPARLDGAATEPHVWRVSFLEDHRIFTGDFGYLVTGVPISGETACDLSRGEGAVSTDVIRGLLGVVSMDGEREILRKLADICLEHSCSGEIEVLRNGDPVFSTFSEAASGRTMRWQTGPSLLLDGREYGTRFTPGVNVALLESLCEAVSSLRGTAVIKSSSVSASRSLRNSMNDLAAYLEGFCTDTAHRTEALLSFLDASDHFAGFARTILYASETSSAAAELLKAALAVSRENYRVVSLERFFAGFHTAFAERGLRPPTLSMKEGLPEVTIMPEAVLGGISMLCQNHAVESPVAFSLYPEAASGEVQAVLTITGFPENLEQTLEGFHPEEPQTFGPAMELAVLFEILEVSGCPFAGFSPRGLRFVLGAVSRQ